VALVPQVFLQAALALYLWHKTLALYLWHKALALYLWHKAACVPQAPCMRPDPLVCWLPQCAGVCWLLARVLATPMLAPSLSVQAEKSRC
jgi:hypothetical protein